MTKDPVQEWLEKGRGSLEDGSFVKASLSDYKGGEEGLKQIHVRKILVKRQEVLSFTYRYKTRDIVKNYPVAEALEKIRALLGRDFHQAVLQTILFDLVFDARKKSLKENPPSSAAPPSLDHDRRKVRHVETASRPWLHALGITDAQGHVRKDAQDKYRQIDKYIETVSGLIRHMPGRETIRIADMGAGKGYLTFALYDYLANSLGQKADVTGVEYRADLVALCNDVARESGFAGLRFVQGTIDSYEAEGIDMLIALHACDTATDDAIAKGVKANAELIVVAPCCHKQIRREMEKHKAGNPLGVLLRHGVFMERQVEMVTDGLRALLLEYEGYTVKVFEFISDTHTPKNVMIAATRNPQAKKRDSAILAKIAETKSFFGIETHALERALAPGNGPAI